MAKHSYYQHKFAHNYPDDWGRNAALINIACKDATKMYRALANIEKKLKIEHPSLAFGKALLAV